MNVVVAGLLAPAPPRRSGRPRADGQRDLEYVVLRYQLKLLSRQKSGRLQLRTSDRAVLAAAALFLPRERRSCLLVSPDTLRRWHRQFVAGDRRALASQGVLLPR